MTDRSKDILAKQLKADVAHNRAIAKAMQENAKSARASAKSALSSAKSMEHLAKSQDILADAADERATRQEGVLKSLGYK